MMIFTTTANSILFYMNLRSRTCWSRVIPVQLLELFWQSKNLILEGHGLIGKYIRWKLISRLIGTLGGHQKTFDAVINIHLSTKCNHQQPCQFIAIAIAWFRLLSTKKTQFQKRVNKFIVLSDMRYFFSYRISILVICKKM